MRDLIILGAGGAGFDIISIVTQINRVSPTWNILGFLDDNEELMGLRFMEYRVLDTIESAISYKGAFFISSIAHSGRRFIRKNIFEKIKSFGGEFATIIHPNVTIYEGTMIGEGCVINANCVIGSKAIIGIDVHIAYGCNIAHETIIGDHCALGSGVNISSGVNIGDNSYIGCGVSTTHDVNILQNSLVTVGSAVVRPLETADVEKTNNTWIGNPAENSIKYMRKQAVLDKLVKQSRRAKGED